MQKQNVNGSTGYNKDLSKESNEHIEEILIYYFHIVVSKVRFTGSVGRSSVKQNLHNSIKLL